jgi:hypothetical protein
MYQYQRIINFEPCPMVAEPLTFKCGKEKRRERRAKKKEKNN